MTTNKKPCCEKCWCYDTSLKRDTPTEGCSCPCHHSPLQEKEWAEIKETTGLTKENLTEAAQKANEMQMETYLKGPDIEGIVRKFQDRFRHDANTAAIRGIDIRFDKHVKWLRTTLTAYGAKEFERGYIEGQNNKENNEKFERRGQRAERERILGIVEGLRQKHLANLKTKTVC